MFSFQYRVSIISFLGVLTTLGSESLNAKSIALKSYDKKSAIYYNQCVECHGYKAEKSAFNRARPLRELSKSELYKKLLYYKNGANLKLTTEMVMNKQIKNVNKRELKNIVEYISSLPLRDKKIDLYAKKE